MSNNKLYIPTILKILWLQHGFKSNFYSNDIISNSMVKNSGDYTIYNPNSANNVNKNTFLWFPLLGHPHLSDFVCILSYSNPPNPLNFPTNTKVLEISIVNTKILTYGSMYSLLGNLDKRVFVQYFYTSENYNNLKDLTDNLLSYLPHYSLSSFCQFEITEYNQEYETIQIQFVNGVNASWNSMNIESLSGNFVEYADKYEFFGGENCEYTVCTSEDISFRIQDSLSLHSEITTTIPINLPKKLNRDNFDSLAFVPDLYSSISQKIDGISVLPFFNRCRNDTSLDYSSFPVESFSTTTSGLIHNIEYDEIFNFLSRNVSLLIAYPSCYSFIIKSSASSTNYIPHLMPAYNGGNIQITEVSYDFDTQVLAGYDSFNNSYFLNKNFSVSSNQKTMSIDWLSPTKMEISHNLTLKGVTKSYNTSSTTSYVNATNGIVDYFWSSANFGQNNNVNIRGFVWDEYPSVTATNNSTTANKSLIGLYHTRYIPHSFAEYNDYSITSQNVFDKSIFINKKESVYTFIDGEYVTDSYSISGITANIDNVWYGVNTYSISSSNDSSSANSITASATSFRITKDISLCPSISASINKNDFSYNENSYEIYLQKDKGLHYHISRNGSLTSFNPLFDETSITASLTWLTSGLNTLLVYGTDLQDNSTNVISLTAWKQFQAPVTSATSYRTNLPILSLPVQKEPYCDLYINDEIISNSYSASSLTAYLPINNGINGFTLYVVDDTSLSSPSISITAVKDLNSPIYSITSDYMETYDTTYTVSMTKESSVYIYLNGSVVENSYSATSLSIVLPLELGNNSFNIYAKDDYDTTAGEIDFTINRLLYNISNYHIQNSPSYYTISGTKPYNCMIKINSKVYYDTYNKTSFTIKYYKRLGKNYLSIATLDISNSIYSRDRISYIGDYFGNRK